MRLPIRHVADNIVFTTTGATWAVWKISPVNYAHASRPAKRALLEDTESLFKSLSGEFVLASVCPSTDAGDVVRAMISGVDLEASPDYAAVCEAQLDGLEQMDLRHRVRFLAVPLPGASRVRAAAGVLAGAAAAVQTALGLPAPAVGPAEVAERVEQAEQLRASWPTRIRMAPASPAEILWLYARSARRGVSEPMLPGPGDGAFGLAALSEVLFDEGGKTDQAPGAKRPRRVGDPFGARILKVASEHGNSYQAFLALAEMPAAFAFPGAEWLAHLDTFDFPIDWVVAGKVVPRSEAEARSRRQARELKAQTGEYAGGVDGAAAPHALLDAQEQLEDMRSRLAASASEVEIQASTVLAVYSDDPVEASRRAEVVRKSYAGNDYQLTRPTGGQLACYTAFLPGAVPPRMLGDYRQHLLARDFAMCMPFAGNEVGDEHGALYGMSLTGSGAAPVLVDFALGPRLDASASAAFVGELGSGKSVAMKTAAFYVLARGRRTDRPRSRGRVLAVDRTPGREWVRFLTTCPGDTQVIEISETAAISLDPLRIFAGAAAVRYAASFLSVLLGVKTMSEEDLLLSEAISEVARHRQPSMLELARVLAERAEAGEVAAASLARKLRVIGGKQAARALFDQNLPPLTVSAADSIVFAVSELSLPKPDELASEYRLARLPFEKLFGQATLVLLAAICREVAFADPAEFTLVDWDESWWMSGSPEGRQLMLELVRDGRKHNAAAHFGLHDPTDLGAAGDEAGDTLRGLLSLRFLFRHRTAHLAARGLNFLGLDGADPDLLELVTSGLSPVGLPEDLREIRAGECLHRDLAGRIGYLKVLVPTEARVAAAILTTPGGAAGQP